MQETYKRSTVDELYYREESCIYTGGPDAIFSVIAITLSLFFKLTIYEKVSHTLELAELKVRI